MMLSEEADTKARILRDSVKMVSWACWLVRREQGENYAQAGCGVELTDQELEDCGFTRSIGPNDSDSGIELKTLLAECLGP